VDSLLADELVRVNVASRMTVAVIILTVNAVVGVGIETKALVWSLRIVVI
jgi:hypothetical protein